MKRKNKLSLIFATGAFALFVIWTVLVRFVDLSPIGPLGSFVGFSTMNGFVHSLTGVHMWLYTVTDWLGLIPIAVAAAFGFFGLFQWIKRKSLRLVDCSIIALGIFYVAVIAVFVFFEFVVVNYRPVLIEGRLEASYPSSTTMLVMCVMPTALMQLRGRIKIRSLKIFITVSIIVFTTFMVAGRLVSGVHWVSDIIGGALLSASLVLAYAWATKGEKAGH